MASFGVWEMLYFQRHPHLKVCLECYTIQYFLNLLPNFFLILLTDGRSTVVMLTDFSQL